MILGGILGRSLGEWWVGRTIGGSCSGLGSARRGERRWATCLIGGPTFICGWGRSVHDRSERVQCGEYT